MGMMRELLIILVIVLIVFGAGRLPQVLGDVGKGVRAFKKGMGENVDDDEAVPAKKPLKTKLKAKKKTVAKKK